MNKIILLIITSTLLLGCQIKKNKTNTDKPVKSINKFIGNWKSVDRKYPFSGYLIIMKDSTFKYIFGACVSSGFSSGSWRIVDSLICLNTDNTDSCMFLDYFSNNCIDDNSDLDYDHELDSSYMPETTIKGCKPKGSGSYIIFENEEFYIDVDTLKYIFKGENECQIDYNFNIIVIKNDSIK